MTQIRPRPIAKKTAIMTKEQERRYMNSFRDKPCEACGVMDGTVVPAHFNKYIGGTGYRAKGIVSGLCKICHDQIDRREGWTDKDRMWVLERLCQKLLRDRARAWLKEQND